MKKNLRSAVWGVALCCVTGVASGEERDIRCPEFPTPGAGRLQWVAQNLRFNGMPMQIKELSTEETPQQVLAFYQHAWGGSPPYYYEYQVGDWKAIATLREKCFFTVQVQPQGRGARALLGVSTRPDNGQLKKPGADFPAMSGSRVVNDIDHFDGGKTGRTILLMNSFSPGTNVNFYRSALADDGWVAIVDRTVDAGKGLSHVLVMKRGHNETNMTISPVQNGTSVMVTMVDRP